MKQAVRLPSSLALSSLFSLLSSPAQTTVLRCLGVLAEVSTFSLPSRSLADRALWKRTRLPLVSHRAVVVIDGSPPLCSLCLPLVFLCWCAVDCPFWCLIPTLIGMLSHCFVVLASNFVPEEVCREISPHMHVLYVVRCVLWASCDFVLVPRYDGAVGVMLFPALVYDAALVVHRRAARLKKVTSGCASSASSTDNRPSCGLIKVGVAAAFFLALLRSFTLQYLGWFSLRRMCLCDGRMRAYRSLYSYPM